MEGRSEGLMRGNLIAGLDARAIMLQAGTVAVLSFVLSNPLYLGVLAASVWLVIAAAGLAHRCRPYLAGGLLGAASIAVINPLVSRQGLTVLWQGPVLPVIGRLNITAEAVAFGGGMGLRMLCVVSAFALYSTAVNPDVALRILARLSFGSALVMALAVRLLPTMAGDARRIMDAQRARGLRMDAGGWRRRVAARKPVIDCLLLTSLERAVQTAESMESRGYGRAGRTSIPLGAWQPRDWIVVVPALAALAAGAVLAAAGPGRFAYYPLLANPAGRSDLLLLPVFGLILAVPGMFSWGWDRSHWLRSRI